MLTSSGVDSGCSVEGHAHIRLKGEWLLGIDHGPAPEKSLLNICMSLVLAKLTTVLHSLVVQYKSGGIQPHLLCSV